MADANQPQDPFEMFRRLWGPLGVPVPGMAMPTLDPQEIEKRIQDLKSVEAWLSMNLNMLRAGIQGRHRHARYGDPERAPQPAEHLERVLRLVRIGHG